jgi:hypothetical protein
MYARAGFVALSPDFLKAHPHNQSLVEPISCAACPGSAPKAALASSASAWAEAWCCSR